MADAGSDEPEGGYQDAHVEAGLAVAVLCVGGRLGRRAVPAADGASP